MVMYFQASLLWGCLQELLHSRMLYSSTKGGFTYASLGHVAHRLVRILITTLVVFYICLTWTSGPLTLCEGYLPGLERIPINVHMFQINPF